MRNKHMDDKKPYAKMPLYNENCNNTPVETSEKKCCGEEKCNPEKPLTELPTQILEKVLYLRYTQRLEQIMAELTPLMQERDILMLKLRSFQEIEEENSNAQ